MCLKLSLNKTKMHMLVKFYDELIPRLRDCDFKCHGSVYWMEYQRPGGDCIQVTLMAALGVTILRVVNQDTSDEQVHQVEISYLQDNGMLKSA